MESKNAFLFYASNLDVLEQFPEEEAGRLALVIMEYGFADESYECSQDDKDLLHHIFIGIDREKKRYKESQRLSQFMNKVSSLTGVQGITEKEVEIALKNLKRLKARAHRQDVTDNEILGVLDWRIKQTLHLESPAPFEQLRSCIVNCASPPRQKMLVDAFNNIVIYFYTCKNVEPPNGMLFKKDGG